MINSLYMETTKIGPEQTVAEIQKVLGLYGAAAIRTDYENGEVTSLSFLMRTDGQEIPFRLPCRWKTIFDHLQRKRKFNRSLKAKDDELQAKRVAWRQILRWVEAQLALVDTGMVKVVEVFLPYVQMSQGETFYERWEKNQYQIEWKGSAK